MSSRGCAGLLPMSYDAASEGAIALRVQGVGKEYRVYPRPIDRLKQAVIRDRRFFTAVRALRDVSFEVRPGDTVGIVGRNGSGKSTLLQIIAGTLTPTSGTVEANGRMAALLELGAGFNPDFTGRENVRLNAALIGLSREETQEKLEEILAFSELGEFIDRPVRTYSSGMHVRLAFAVAISVDPDIFIVDEALAVGDEAFQRKCYSRLEAIQRRGGTILFVSHSAWTVSHLCNRALLLDRGELLLDDRPKLVITQYHRMVYAPSERQEALRAEIMALRDRPERLKRAPAGTSAKPAMKPQPGVSRPVAEANVCRAYYDPGLFSRSRTTYESRGAVIEEPRIETLEGERVNVLCRGETYVYTFRVRFIDAAFGVRFGMYVRTITGVDLGGSASAGPLDVIDYLEAGEVATVRFRFTCSLLPATFFVNSGVSGLIDGERHFLHRMVDADVFRVQPETDLLAGGLVDFSVEPDVRLETAETA
jgi:lipopolysaccharide transport system ATP-binding protein